MEGQRHLANVDVAVEREFVGVGCGVQRWSRPDGDRIPPGATIVTTSRFFLFLFKGLDQDFTPLP